MKIICRCLLLFLAFALVGFAKKESAVIVRFHTEANKLDTASFALPVELKNPPRAAFLDKIPAITENEIAAIYPFPAGDGTMGCAFKLDEHGRISLDTLSVEKRGGSIVATVNGRNVIDMVVDKRVSDGIITIPSGLTVQEIQMLAKKFKVLGQTKKKKK